MISETEKQQIISCAQKYRPTKVILFGSAIRSNGRDIDLGLKGVPPALFFEFGWELCRVLSRPVDIVDLDQESQFNRLVEREGVVLYGEP